MSKTNIRRGKSEKRTAERPKTKECIPVTEGKLEEEGSYEEEIFCRCSSCSDDFDRGNGDDVFCGLVAAEWTMVLL